MRTIFLDYMGKKFYECDISVPLKHMDNIFYDKYQLEVINARHDVIINDNGSIEEYDLVWTDYKGGSMNINFYLYEDVKVIESGATGIVIDTDNIEDKVLVEFANGDREWHYTSDVLIVPPKEEA